MDRLPIACRNFLPQYVLEPSVVITDLCGTHDWQLFVVHFPPMTEGFSVGKFSPTSQQHSLILKINAMA